MNTLKHCTAADVGITIEARTDNDPEAAAEAEKLTKALDQYFHVFAKPRLDKGFALGRGCLKCDTPLTGMLGAFQWGLAHGEGRCSKCGWPARVYHRPKDEEGDEIFDNGLEEVLQYHPDHVSKK